MRAFLDGRLPSFEQLTAAITVDVALRYLFLAGLAWMLGYVLFRRRWFHRKIVAAFPGSSELRREIAWSLLSIFIFGLTGAATLMASRHGWTQLYWRVGDHGWGWFWGSIACAIFLHDAYFYWTHRLMHHPKLFGAFHRVHHLSHNPTPWASYAFAPLEAVVQASIFPLAVTVMPMHPLAFGLFMLWQIIFNVLGHTGYEFHPHGLMNSWLRRILNTPTNHVMHHEKLRGNYGLYFNLWDRLMGTNHEDYEKRFREVTSRPAGSPRFHNHSMSLLKADRLKKSFGTLRAVDGVSFAVRPGEIYGLLGPNGAGKTTTLSMLCGLLKPDSGEIIVDGMNFWSDPNRARAIMGAVPQEVALYPELSGRENLEFWGRLAGLSVGEARRRAGELLEALTLSDRANDAVSQYSGGMKRRINLGAALLHRPRLLLLDEPTVGIDPQGRANLLEYIRGLVAEGMGLLYTTHYLEEAESICQRIGIIDQGRILAEGTLAELQERLGGDRLFTLEGDFTQAKPGQWTGFHEHFRIIQQSDRQILLAATTAREPAACLQELLALPVRVENVTFKRPSLNEVFLQLTGRELRE